MPARRLNVASLRPPDAFLEMPDGTSYPVRGNLPIETMIELLDLEQTIQGDDGQESLTALKRANQVIVDIVKEKTPDAPDTFGLGIEEVLGTLSFLVGADSVRAEVVDVVTNGAGSTVDPQTVELDADGERVDRGDETPLPSERHSPSISSGSAPTTGGGRSGGSATRGEPSASTARTRRAS